MKREINPYNFTGNILQNADKHVDAENIDMNRSSYYLYLFRLLDIAMSVFKWINLPKGVDERMLEFWLIQNGFCGFFYDEDLKYGKNELNAPEGFAVLQMMIAGQFDMYNYPRERRAYAVNGLNIDLNESNSVIIFNDYLRVPMFSTIMLYAKRLAEIDRTIDINLRAQKTPKIICCDEKQRLSFKNLAAKVDGNMYWVMADKSLDLNDVSILDVTAPYVCNEMQVLKHQLWNEALTYLGIENVNTEKKERIITTEVMSNMGDVEAQRFTRLNARKLACKQINELFSDKLESEIDCDFRSGMYIKADGYGAQQIKTSGFEESTVQSPESGYN